MKCSAISTPARFADNGDGTITSIITGLMWSKATLCGAPVDYAQAEKLCAALDLGGCKDWRMPALEELFPLPDRSKAYPPIDVVADRTSVRAAIEADMFPDTQPEPYWTSTVHVGATACRWVVDFNYGGVYHHHGIIHGAFVRAVRTPPEGPRP